MELLSDSEIESRLADLEGWEREGDAISKTFELADFVGSVEFVDRLVEPAEELGHHPDLSISWNRVSGLDHDATAAGRLDGERLRARPADRRLTTEADASGRRRCASST